MKFSVLKTMFHQSIVLLFVLAVSTVAGFAQAGTTGVSGTVKDQNGGAVPGATVKITNSATSFERSTTTNADGSFSILGVPPATYRMEISATGFKKVVNAELRLLVDSPSRFDPTLEAGDVSAVVDVT